jgi:hypothetical protein
MVDGPETNPWCNRVTSTEIDRKEDRRNDASWLSIAAGPPSTPLRTSNHTAGSSRGTRTRLRWRLPGLGSSRGPSSSGRAGESPRGPVPASPERGPAMLLPTKPGDGGLPNHMPPQKGRILSTGKSHLRRVAPTPNNPWLVVSTLLPDPVRPTPSRGPLSRTAPSRSASRRENRCPIAPPRSGKKAPRSPSPPGSPHRAPPRRSSRGSTHSPSARRARA